jgi:hypothetical protein
VPGDIEHLPVGGLTSMLMIPVEVTLRQLSHLSGSGREYGFRPEATRRHSARVSDNGLQALSRDFPT